MLERAQPRGRVAPLINAYAVLFTQEAAYSSDPNKRLQVDDFLGVLTSHDRPVLQLLFLPVIWVAGGEHHRGIFSGAWKPLSTRVSTSSGQAGPR
jgi:hypothetical protein